MGALSLLVCVLSFLGEELPPSPQPPAITAAQAARLYRIEVYHQFRLDRREYDRRRAQGAQVWQAYRAAGEPNEQRDAVVQWFTAARQAAHTGTLPDMPAFAQQPVDQPEVTVAAPAAAIPVNTSGLAERPLVDRLPPEATTTLEIQLPPAAERTEPAPAFTTVAKQATAAAPPPLAEIEGTTEPVIVELPADKHVVDPSAPSPAIGEAPATESTPKAEPSAPAPAAAPIAVEDPFAVQSLFEPAVTPAETSEAATDVDPFGG